MTKDDFSKVMDYVNEGLVPPLQEDQRGGPNLTTLPDEEVTWIGKIDSDDMLFARHADKYAPGDVLLGVSPYHVVLFVESGAFRTRFVGRSL